MNPPQHSSTAKIQYVSKADSNWDTERFIEESNALDEHTAHPLGHYWNGDTRFDLDAPHKLVIDGEEKTVTARDYLKDGAVVWTLKRLGFRRLSQLKNLIEAGRGGDAQLEAFIEGVEACSAVDLDFRRSKLSDDCVDKIADRFGIDTVWAVGDAVILAARRPTPAEKKA